MDTHIKAVTGKKARSSISTKIILVQMAVVLCAMGGYGLLSYMQRSKQLNQSIQTREKQVEQRLPASLSIPLWNMDNASVDMLVGLEMMDPDVQAIVVSSDSGVRGKVRDQASLPVDYTEADGKALAASRLHLLAAKVVFQEKAFGTVDVYYSDASIRAQLKADLVSTFGMTLSVILVLALATWLISRFLLRRPLALVDFAVERIAHGDLSATVHFKSSDELGSLADGINEMIAQLRGMVGQIRGTAESLAGSSTQISESARQLASSAQSQAATLEETSASVEELTSSVEQVATHAQNQAASVEQSSHSMNEMRTSAEDVSRTLKDVSVSSQESVRMAHSGVDAVNASVLAIQSIAEKSEQIGSIVTVISDIADQTNLLSLNASIEAARAGEHGRGFAVVAQEVSKLAERSGSSTREIRKLISDTEQNVTKGVRVAQGALEAMNAIIVGAQNTNQAIETLSGRIQAQIQSISTVAAATESITEMSHSISAATEEQTTNARQVATAMENVNELTQQAADAADQMSHGTIELTNLAQQLKALVKQFAVAETGATTDLTSRPTLTSPSAGPIQALTLEG
ncbi:MAG: methyl-accepting chemotaxis protein [Spirochaetia bacterium]